MAGGLRSSTAQRSNSSGIVFGQSYGGFYRRSWLDATIESGRFRQRQLDRNCRRRVLGGTSTGSDDLWAAQRNKRFTLQPAIISYLRTANLSLVTHFQFFTIRVDTGNEWFHL